ncbi:MAG: DJ-1/PfpI family protein [Bacteroidales bacterium]|nr:DJ-1/PfpI family protein [Bacteroidales bacterium]
MKGVYIFLADGFEETEALTTVDMLRRGSIDVKIVSNTDERSAKSSHKIHVMTDMTFSEFLSTVQLDGTTDKDFMIFPGGMPGSTNLASNEKLMDLMLKHYNEGGSVAAICAAPSVVLSKLPGLEGKTMTCYDGFEPALEEKGVSHTKDGVAKDDRIITGRGAGHTIAFGLKILAHISGQAAADTVAKSIML